MDRTKIQVKGSGPIVEAKVENPSVPLIDVPLLRKIKFSRGERVSFFDGKGNGIGGIRLRGIKVPYGESEYILSVLQDGQNTYLVSSARLGGYGGIITHAYFLRKTEDLDSVVSLKPLEIHRENTSCSPGKSVLDNILYEGINVPIFAINHPGSSFGHNGAFWRHYTPITAINLDSQEKNQIVDRASDIGTSRIDGKNLVSVLVPASYMPSLTQEKESEELSRVFNPEDLERVTELNQARDLAHMCFGNRSCIPTSEFEYDAFSDGYPKYRVHLDAKGRVHKSERVFDEEEFQKNLDYSRKEAIRRGKIKL